VEGGLRPPETARVASSPAPGCPARAAARRSALPPLPSAGPTKQVLILLNKYEVMAAGLGAKRPGDILESQMGSAEGRDSLQGPCELGTASGRASRGERELPAVGPAGWSWACDSSLRCAHGALLPSE